MYYNRYTEFVNGFLTSYPRFVLMDTMDPILKSHVERT